MLNRKPRSKTERWCFLQAHNRSCALSGMFISLDEMELDHIIPLSKGGSDTWDNLIPVDRSINRGKSNRRYGPDVEKRLIKKAKAAMPDIEKMMQRKASIPKEELMGVDLSKVTTNEILSDLGPTSGWDWNEIKYLVDKWLKYGVTWIERIAAYLNRTINSVRSKLANIGIYDKDYKGA